MKLTLDTNFKEVQKIVNKRGKDLRESTKIALLRTALAGLNIIQSRTNKGQGYKGGTFDGYSSAYSAFRRNNGRGVVPDLQFTGQMFSAMTVKANSQEAEIFFNRATEAKKAAMNDKSRPFFGFSQRERKTLVSVFERNLK